MNKVTKLSVLWTLRSVVIACLWLPAIAGAATGVWFDEQEPGTDKYIVRMLITDSYLRIDDGVKDSDFILFDRKKRIIYSVNHEDETIIEIVGAPVNMARPEPLVLAAQPQDFEKGPPINGKSVKLYHLTVNGKKCGEVAAAADLLPDVVQALKQFHHALAAEQAIVTQQTPKHLQTDCDLAENVFAPDAYLQHGFPVFHRTSTGKARGLKTFDESFSATEGLFRLPAIYRRLNPAKLRAGG